MEALSFAIIIPVYNVEEYLAECLESVLRQDYKNLQIICVDDGSTDASFEIAYQYFLRDKRIAIVQGPNGGLSKARNIGLDFLFSENNIFIDAENSSIGYMGGGGDYKIFFHTLPFVPDCIHFLDSDDVLEGDCIKECAKLFLKNSAVDIVWHDFYFFYQEMNIIAQESVFPFDLEETQIVSTAEMLKKMKTKHFNFCWHGAFRAKLVEKIRFIERIVYEDVSFAFFLFFQASHIALVNKRLIYYRVREGSITNSKGLMQYPPYMKDLEGYFQTYEEAKLYNFFYSDCVNILEVHAYLTKMSNGCKQWREEINDKDMIQIKNKMTELLDWRAFVFLSLEKHNIKQDRDPRKCIELYKQVRFLGYGGGFLQVFVFNFRKAIQDFLCFLKMQIEKQKERWRQLMWRIIVVLRRILQISKKFF